MTGSAGPPPLPSLPRLRGREWRGPAWARREERLCPPDNSAKRNRRRSKKMLTRCRFRKCQSAGCRKIKPPVLETGGYGQHPFAGHHPARAASSDLEVFRGGLAAVGDELVLEHLPLVEGAEAGPFDGGDMDEDVLVPGRRPNEPIALSWIEPFDGAFLHRPSPRSARTNDETRMQSLQFAPTSRVFWGSSKRSRINACGRTAKNSDCRMNFLRRNAAEARPVFKRPKSSHQPGTQRHPNTACVSMCPELSRRNNQASRRAAATPGRGLIQTLLSWNAAPPE